MTLAAKSCPFCLTPGRIAKKNADAFMSCVVHAKGFRLIFLCLRTCAILATSRGAMVGHQRGF
jgi:hypothetical protein